MSNIIFPELVKKTNTKYKFGVSAGKLTLFYNSERPI